MEINQIVEEASKLIIPALPYLIKGIKIGGKKGAEKLGESGADESLNIAKKLWEVIERQGSSTRKFSIAAKELAKTPTDKTWQTMLQQEFKLLLKTKPEVLKEITALLQIETSEQTVYAKKNTRSVISQSASRTGKQKVRAIENRGLIVRQSIKKEE